MHKPTSSSSLTVTAPCKINLHLRVGRQRDDGFHPLLTWMTTIGLADELRLQLQPHGSGDTFTCNDPSLPTDGRNLVVRATAAMRALLPQAPPVALELHKRVPHGGGLGGGSADAAFTLLALNQLWNAQLPAQALHQAAAALGSDVPFFLYGCSSICRGRGELVRPIAPPAHRTVLLILPNIAMPTAEVYRRFDAMHLGFDRELEQEPDWAHWSQLPSSQLLTHLVNDLEIPSFAVKPELADLRQRAEQTLRRTVRMSGSGSSLFTLYDSADEATDGLAQLRRSLQPAGGLSAALHPLCPEPQLQAKPQQG